MNEYNYLLVYCLRRQLSGGSRHSWSLIAPPDNSLWKLKVCHFPMVEDKVSGHLVCRIFFCCVGNFFVPEIVLRIRYRRNWIRWKAAVILGIRLDFPLQINTGDKTGEFIWNYFIPSPACTTDKWNVVVRGGAIVLWLDNRLVIKHDLRALVELVQQSWVLDCDVCSLSPLLFSEAS